jgi:hypothetical protein
VESVTLVASRDTTIYEHAAGERANGSGGSLFVGRNRDGRTARLLLHFVVAAHLPAGARVVAARLTLHATHSATGPVPVSVHRVLADWGTAGSNAPRGEGQGAAAEPGDATWLHRYFPDALWSQPGGDYASASAVMTASDPNQAYVWAGDGLAADVQAWLAGANHGWLVRTDEREGDVSALRFQSSEGVGPVPSLTIDFVR